MTTISLTSGELMDVIDCLNNRANSMEESDPHLAAYYGRIYQQFEAVLEKMDDLVPENRVANLVLAMN